MGKMVRSCLTLVIVLLASLNTPTAGAMHLGNDTKASKLYSGSFALNDAKDPDIANFLHGSSNHK